VEVACEALSPDETRVGVGYAFTALSAAGESTLAGVSEAAFAAMIEGWKQLILSRIVGT
jgi:hypothetical protein